MPRYEIWHCYEIWHYPSVEVEGEHLDTIEAEELLDALLASDAVPDEVGRWEWSEEDDGSEGTMTNPENPDDCWAAVRNADATEVAELLAPCGPLAIASTHCRLLERLAAADTRYRLRLAHSGAMLDPPEHIEDSTSQAMLDRLLDVLQQGIERPGSWERGALEGVFGEAMDYLGEEGKHEIRNTKP